MSTRVEIGWFEDGFAFRCADAWYAPEVDVTHQAQR
jgi:hypothetical protein